MLFFDSLVGLFDGNQERQDLERLIRVEFKSDYDRLKKSGVLNSSKLMREFLNTKTGRWQDDKKI